jgi:hypothetical protein
LVRTLLNGTQSALKVVVAFAQEAQLQLVAADGLVAALLALDLFQSAALLDGLALGIVAVDLTVVVVLA